MGSKDEQSMQGGGIHQGLSKIPCTCLWLLDPWRCLGFQKVETDAGPTVQDDRNSAKGEGGVFIVDVINFNLLCDVEGNSMGRV